MITKQSLEDATLLCSNSHERAKPCDVCEAIAKRLDAIKDETWTLAESETRKRIAAWLQAAEESGGGLRDLGAKILALVPNTRPRD